MNKFLLISPKNRTVYNFRGDLIKEIISRGYEVVVTGPDKTDVDKIEALGCRFVEIPMEKNGTSIISDLKYCRALKKLMKQEQPDYVLGYTIKPIVYGSIAASKLGIKHINCLVTGGGYALTAKTTKAKIIGTIVKILYKFAFNKAENVIFQNKDDLNEFVSRKLVKKDKCHVVNGSGVNMEYFKPLEMPKEISFFMLSRLLKSKGVREYLQAAKIVKQKHHNVKFYLLGKYENNMQDAIPKEYIEPFIKEEIVERFEETSDVRPYYDKCSVYVLPSYREGTPRTVLEAMACGRPIITTDTNGCRETVKDGFNGYLVPVKDIGSLVDKMEMFINYPELCEKMGNNSIQYCREKYDIKKVNCSLLKIFFNKEYMCYE